MGKGIRRITSFLAAASLAVTLLAGCGMSGDSAEEATAAASEAQTASAAQTADTQTNPSAQTNPAAQTTGTAQTSAADAETTAMETAAGESGESFTITDISGRDITFDRQPQTFIVANYIFNFLLVGGRDSLKKVVGLTKDGWEETRFGEYTALTEAYPEISGIRSIGGYHDDVLNSELILETAPDCILLSSSQYTENETSIPVWEAAGIRVVVLDYHKMILENDVRSTEILGKLLGKEDTAAELNRAYREGIGKVQERIALLTDEQKNIRVYVELGNLGPDFIGNSYDDMLWGAIIDNVGAVNIAKGKLGEGYGPLDQEYIIDRDPEKIIIGGSIWAGDTESSQMRMGLTVTEDEAQERLKPFYERAWWQDVTGIRNREVYGVDHGSLRNALDYTFTEYMAKILYPETFSDIDPQAEYEEMLKKYMPEVTEPGTFMIKMAD